MSTGKKRGQKGKKMIHDSSEGTGKKKEVVVRERCGENQELVKWTSRSKNAEVGKHVESPPLTLSLINQEFKMIIAMLDTFLSIQLIYTALCLLPKYLC